MMQPNSYVYFGQLAWPAQLKNTNSGTDFCPITLKQESSSVNISVFGSLAQMLAGQQQGFVIGVKGYMSSRKNAKSGYFENTLVCKELSFDNGQTWQRDQPNNAAGFQQQAQQQQAQQQNQGAVQQQGTQQAPVQQNPAASYQQQQQASSQPPSAQAMAAQEQLYSPPAQGQQAPAQAQLPAQAFDDFEDTIPF